MANRDQLSPQGKIDRAIQRAWVAALVCGGITLVGGLVAIGGTKLVPGATGGMLVDAVMFFGLAFGVYRRSRICVTLLIVYAISNEVYMIFEGGKPSPLRLIFIYFYFRGMLAAFAHHKQFSKQNASEITSDHAPSGLRRTIQPSGKLDGVVSPQDGRAFGKSLPTAVDDRGSIEQALSDQAHRSVAKKPAFGGHWQIPRRALVFAVAFVMFIGMSLAAWRFVAASRNKSNLQSIRDSVALLETFDAENKPVATGSGFFVSPDGLLVTNFHVIKGATRVVVKLESGAMYEVAGALHGDKNADVILLRVKANGVPFLRLGNSATAEVGEHVWVIGSPLGLEGTVSDGIISAKREIPSRGKLLQITAPIAHGSSGSPVVDTNNEVLGVATLLIGEGQALNFAAPSEAIKNMLVGVTPDTRLTSLATLARGEKDAEKYAANNWYDIGMHYARDKNLKEAITACERAIKIDPQFAEAWFYLGCAEPRADSAAEAWEHYLALSEGDSQRRVQVVLALHGLARCYETLNKADDAEDAYKRAIAIFPNAQNWAVLSKFYQDTSGLYHLKREWD